MIKTGNFSSVDGIERIATDGLDTSNILKLSIGFVILAVTVYSFHLSMKANRLIIAQLKDEGYE